MDPEEAARRFEASRRLYEQNHPRARESAPLSDVMTRYMSSSGLSRRYSLKEVHSAWLAAAGAEAARHCRIQGVRKGVLFVEVDSAACLHEMANFRRKEILAALVRQKGCERIHAIDFRLGALEPE